MPEPWGGDSVARVARPRLPNDNHQPGRRVAVYRPGRVAWEAGSEAYLHIGFRVPAILIDFTSVS